MTRKTFDNELRILNSRLIDMGNLCVEGIDLAINILFNNEEKEKSIARIHEIEKETDGKESDIEALCMKMILRQQPVARDLKMISSALRMIADMERIGDQIADIADIAKNLSKNPLNGETHIREMANETKEMVIGSIEAYVNKDIKKADIILKKDETVDALFVQLKGELLKVIYNEIAKGEIVLNILMIGKYFERIGDHATNIAEAVKVAYK